MRKLFSCVLRTALLTSLVCAQLAFSQSAPIKIPIEKISSDYLCKGKKCGPDIIVLDKFQTLSNGLPNGETPASIGCIYGLTPRVPGCPINGTSTPPDGGWGVIAVTEGGDDPNAYDELMAFSQAFNLRVLPQCDTNPPPCFQVVYATQNGLAPAPAPCTDTDCVALIEHVIDIEWAHAMAPNASIVMVEAESFEPPFIYNAVDAASQYVAANGGGIVSNSWSQPESAGELALDAHFQTPGVMYIASSGDYCAPARYPASSPYVIAAGGTKILRDKAGNYIGQTAWRDRAKTAGAFLSGGSGGPSMFEPRPFYQNIVAKIVGNSRGTPDISFVADPFTGVDIYLIKNGTPTWLKVGGTSLASPALAGIINAANSGARTTAQELSIIYNGAIKNYHRFWSDILVGNNGHACLQGYDFATGLGTPLTYGGK